MIINFGRKNRQTLFLIFILFFITICIVFYCQYPSLKYELIYNADINLFSPPIYSLLNHSLFKNDIITQYVLFQTPKGYITLLYLLAHFFDPILLAKILPFILAIITVLYLFLYGRGIGGNLAGFIISILFIFNCWTFQTFQGTTPRAFVYPLLIPFIYFLFKKKYLVCLILYTLQILFYPSISLVSFLTFLFSNINIKDRKINIQCPALILLAFLLLPPSLYLLQYGAIGNKLYGPFLSLQDMLKMPEFYFGGKEPFFFYNIWQLMQSKRAGFEMNAPLVFLLTVAILLYFLLKKIKKVELRLPKEIIFLCLASIVLYFLSYIFLLYLYYPSRYIIFSIPLFLCISIGILFVNLLHSYRTNAEKNIVIIFFIIFVVSFYTLHINGRVKDYRNLEEVLRYLATAPEDSIIAANPVISDPIPAFCKRKVLFSRRLLIPFRKRYYEIVKKRVLDFYDAYYADSFETVKKFCSIYSVNYIVLDKWHFSPDYFKTGIEGEHEPFRSHIYDVIRKKKNFVLPKIDKNNIVFDKDNFMIINTSNFR